MVTKRKNLTQIGTDFSKYLLIYSAIKLNVLAPELGSINASSYPGYD